MGGFFVGFSSQSVYEMSWIKDLDLIINMFELKLNHIFIILSNITKGFIIYFIT